MASSIDLQKNKGPIVDPGICRCCRSIKKCRFLATEYEWMGKKEVYSDMFMDCFGLLLSYLDGDEKESAICATCVTRLREACAFRQQVLQSEEAFLQAKLQAPKDGVEYKMEINVKTEPFDENVSDTNCDDRMDSVDAMYSDEELKETKPIKIPKSTKASTAKIKTRASTRKKTKESSDISKKDVVMKKKLLSDMKKIKTKLKKQLEEPATITHKKKRDVNIDQEHMSYLNTVAIVTTSYVCPFHNRVSNYYCFYCKEQFTDPAELREHTLSHDPKDFPNMVENKRPPKIDITRIDCRLCPEKIDDLSTLKTHITSIHNKTIFNEVTNEFLKFKLTLNNLSCTECNISFPYFDMLKKHMTDHFGTFTCDSCGACFLEHNSLLTHIRSHKKPNVDTMFPCEICGKNLKSKYSRYMHVATVHEKKATVNCYKCEASFLSYALRNRHLIEVHGDKRTFPCKLCDKVYNRRKTLMEHNRRNHLKVFRHQCDLCDQKFYLPSRLKEHMVTHTGERNFRCEYCEKSYPRLKSLREHIRTHTNDRRFKCDVCNSTFTQSGSLRSHMKSHHNSFVVDGSFT